MPPLSLTPLVIDHGAPPLLVERIFPATTRDQHAASTLRLVSGAPHSILAFGGMRLAANAEIAPAARKCGFSAMVFGYREPPPEYLAAARVIVMGAHSARDRRARQRREEEGARLRERRIAAGLSTGQAAKRLGVSRREFYRMERGEKRAPAWVWGRILGTGE